MERRTNAIIYLMVAFSAIVTYLYGTYLDKSSGFLPMEEHEIMARPTEEQMARARRLGLTDRLLATTKEIWPECAAQQMTAIDCKFFIDDEILRLFTDEDKFIKSRIIGKRTTEDDWYNAVEIIMDDNGLTLGRDSDGWIYYTFQWEGSGVEATEQQQGEIPPITAEETTSGSAEGSVVETVYAPDATADFPVQDPELPIDDPTLPTTTLATTTAVPPPPQDTIGAATISPPTDLSVGNAFDYTEPPLILEPIPVLAQGASTDAAIAGTDDSPINGGVIIDGSAPNSGEGQGKFEWALNEPPTIVEEGSRTIGPFDCRGMTGFACCLVIKHQVRDADIYGKAIQCHLDYEETTCHKKWWLATETSKKVLIYANHNEMVSLDPEISGAWPQCEEKWTDDTHDWADKVTEERCGKDFNDAVCSNGACCSAHGHCGTGASWCDFGCQQGMGQCWATSDTTGLQVREQCGAAVGGKVCAGTYCCSSSGTCGSGSDYCEKDKGCQSQCWGGGIQEVPPQVPEVCKAKANVCVALDMSGSVCSPDFNNPTQCSKCPSSCRSWGLDRNTCCPNFSKVKEFGTTVVNWINHLQFGINSRSLSLVTFATGADIKTNLGDDIMSGLKGLDYTGGLTNHGSAIESCQSTFDGSSDDSTKNFILLVTDGVPTTQYGNYNAAEGDAHARNRASIAKAAGTNIETVFINPSQANANVISYMNALSSSGKHYDVSDFAALEKVVNDIAYKIGCSGDGVITPVAAPVDQASIPAERQAITHCGCSQCTEAVMESYAGKYTCKARLEWVMKFDSENKACRTIYKEYPEICKCHPNCDN